MSVCLELPLASPVSPSGLGKRKRTGIMRGDNGDGIQMINGKMAYVQGSPSTVGESFFKRQGRAASPEDEYRSDGQSEADDAPEASSSKTVPTQRVEKAPRKPPNRKSRYACTWQACAKTYTRPVRLAEHMRSHTGERPFMCPQDGCSANYLRETHLAAHLRTHKDDEEKPLGCEEEGCDKRFWTNQHLKRHIRLVHENGKGSYPVRTDEASSGASGLTDKPASDSAINARRPSTSITSCDRTSQKRTCLTALSRLSVITMDAAGPLQPEPSCEVTKRFMKVCKISFRAFGHLWADLYGAQMTATSACIQLMLKLARTCRPSRLGPLCRSTIKLSILPPAYTRSAKARPSRTQKCSRSIFRDVTITRARQSVLLRTKQKSL